jgi:hypothetical protein
VAERKREPRPGEGRPIKYKQEYCKQLITYFEEAEGFPTYAGFAVEIEVDTSTLERWADRYKEFCGAYARAKAIQEAKLVSGAMQNKYNSQFAQFFAKNNLGFRDKTEQDINATITMTDAEKSLLEKVSERLKDK